MAKILKVYSKKKIESSDYVNPATGEPLSSEIPDITSVMILNKELKIIDSSEFIIIDSSALRYIQSICSKADLEKILRMSNMVKGRYNILYDNDGTAHSTTTLRMNLEYDSSEFSRFMKRLLTKSIIYYLSGYKNGRKCRRVMLNPTLARKSKTFHVDCISVFENLSNKKINTGRTERRLLRAA